MRKIVVYYRSRKTRILANGSAVTLLQKKAVEKWAWNYEIGPESGQWKIIGQYHDNYRGRDNQKRSDLPGLDKALDHCKAETATLVYVNIKIWRPNPFIDDRIDDFVREFGSDRIFVIPTTRGDGAEEIRDFFEKTSKNRKRQDKAKKISRTVRKHNLQRGNGRDPQELKEAQSRGGKTKRARNLEHITVIALNIIDWDKRGLTNLQIADELNRKKHKTVSGKLWTVASVSKTRSEMRKPGFRDRVISAKKFLSPSYKPTKFVMKLPN